MNSKTILAIALGAVTHFFLGFLIYGLLLMDFMQANTIEYAGLMKEGSGAMVGYALSSVFFAMLLTYVLRQANTKNARGGLITAGIVSVLYALSLDMMFYFGMNLHTGAFIAVDIVAFTVMGSLTGMVIGMVLSRKKATATSGASVV